MSNSLPCLHRVGSCGYEFELQNYRNDIAFYSAVKTVNVMSGHQLYCHWVCPYEVNHDLFQPAAGMQ